MYVYSNTPIFQHRFHKEVPNNTLNIKLTLILCIRMVNNHDSSSTPWGRDTILQRVSQAFQDSFIDKMWSLITQNVYIKLDLYTDDIHIIS